MKPRKTHLLALGLSVTILSTMCPISVQAAAIAPVNQTQAVDASTKKQTTSAFRKGEAIVLWKNSISTDEITEENATGLSDDEIELVDTLQFGEITESDAESATGASLTAAQAADTSTIQLYRSKTLNTNQLIQKLKQNKNIASVQPNYIHTTCASSNDPYFEEQWALQNDGQNGGTIGADTGVNAVWNGTDDIPATKSSDRIVAVLDTGIDMTHEDLKDHLWENPYQGMLPGEHGYNFVNNTTIPQDDNGHGSHCAGIISATADNSKGISGICPGVKLMPLKVLDGFGSGDDFDILRAFDYVYRAKKLGVNVVATNNSWGGDDTGIVMADAVEKLGKAGVISVFAAGNSADDLSKEKPQTTDEMYDDEEESEDSLLNSPYVINVAATNERGNVSDFSNYGKNVVDLAAPGCGILSTVPFGTFNPRLDQKTELLPDIQSADQTSDQASETSYVYAYRNYDHGEVPVYAKDEKGIYRASEKVFGYPSDIAIFSSNQKYDKKATVEVSHTKDSAYGKSGSGLKVTLKNMKANTSAIFAIPYRLPADQKIASTVSMMIKTTSSQPFDAENVGLVTTRDAAAEEVEDILSKTNVSGISFSDMLSNNYGYVGNVSSKDGDYWSHATFDVTQNSDNEASDRSLIFQVYTAQDGDCSFYLDDLGFTSGLNENEAENFPKYDYYSGTSMATPYVTGAVALASSVYPKASATELRNRICGSITQTPELKEKTISGGRLDLSKLSKPQPTIEKLSLNSDGSLHIKGFGFVPGKTSITVNGLVAVIKTAQEKELVVQASNLQNKTVAVELTTPYGSQKKTAYLTKGSSYTTVGKQASITYDEDLNDFSYLPAPATDGKKLYFYNSRENCIESIQAKTDAKKATKFVYAKQKTSVALPTQNATLATEEDALLSASGETRIGSNLVYTAKKLYYIADVYEPQSVYHELKLYCIDLSKNTPAAVKIADLPKSFQYTSDPTLAAYQGNLYLLGGYNYKTHTFAKDTYCMATSKGKTTWKKSISLPEGRVGGRTAQVGNRLYYALGVSKKDTGCPKTLVFNGKTWKVLGKAVPSVLQKGSKTYGTDNFDWYTGSISAYKNQLLFSGMAVDGLGDTFTQNLSDGSYHKTNYFAFANPEKQRFVGTVVGDKLMGIFSENFVLSNRYIPLKDSLNHVTVTSKNKHGKVVCTPKQFVSGDKVTIRAVANKGYHLVSLKVNGKKIKNGVYSGYPTTNLKVNATFAANKTKKTNSKK